VDDRREAGVLLGRERKQRREDRSMAGLALDFDSPVMAVDHPLGQTQPKTRALDARRSGRVCAEEMLEYVRRDRRIDADAGVPYGQSCTCAFPRHRHDDMTTGWSELDGVVEQVEHEPFEPVHIPLHGHGIGVFTPEDEAFRLRHGLELLDERRGECTQVDGTKREGNLASLRARERQDPIDESFELVDLFKLAGKAAPDLLVRTGLQHRHFNIASERSQGRAELVCQGGAELTHLANGVLQSSERVVEGDGHVVEFVPRTPNR